MQGSSRYQTLSRLFQGSHTSLVSYADTWFDWSDRPIAQPQNFYFPTLIDGSLSHIYVCTYVNITGKFPDVTRPSFRVIRLQLAKVQIGPWF